MKIPAKEVSLMLHHMERMAVIILGDANIRPLTGDEIGASYVDSNETPNILIGTRFEFQGGLSVEEAVQILYGVFAHEVLHLLLTDFGYSFEHISKYPKDEQEVRQTVMNIIEDPAIEYLRSERLPSALNVDLDRAIRYFTEQEDPIDQAGSTKLSQLLNAMIQFGDLGYVKGRFTYPEAERLFGEIAPMMNQAISSPAFKERFSIGMKIADKVLPLYKEGGMPNLASKRNYSKKAKSMKGIDRNGETKSPKENAAAQARKLTVHLIDGEGEANVGTGCNSELAPEVTDLYVAESQNGGSGESVVSALQGRDVTVIDERRNQETLKKKESVPAREDLSGFQKESGTDSNTDSNADSGKDALQKTDESFEERVRRVLEKVRDYAAENHAEEGAGTDEKERLLEIQSLLQKEAAVMASETVKAKTKRVTGDIHPEVISPYIEKNVPYHTVTINSCPATDEALCKLLQDKDMRNYISGLKASFMRIFRQKEARKEYKTNGHIDAARVSGRKVTARIFSKRRLPEDKSDLSVLILVDESGSMCRATERLKQTLILILEAFRPCGVKVKIVGFETERSENIFRHFGGNGWENTRSLESACMSLRAFGGTFLGHAIRYGGTLLKNSPERKKMFICITDGEPSSAYYRNTADGLNDCRSAVKEIEKSADVIGIGLYDNDDMAFEYIFGKNAVSMSRLDTLITVLPKKIQKLLVK